jgi:hypothetical protein
MQHGLVTWKPRFGDGGQVRKCARALRPGDRQRAHLAVAHQADRGRQRREHDRHVAAEQIGQCRTRAAIGHVVELDARHAGEQLGRQVHAAAAAGRGEIELAGALLGERDQFGDGFRGY